MKNFSRQVVFLGALGTLAGGAWAEAPRSVEAFARRGVIADPRSFFVAAGAAEEGQPGSRALVTEEGVYAFMETPENERHLSRTPPGSVVRVEGKLLKEGALVYIDTLELQTAVPFIDFARFRRDPGEAVSLKGVNKCQCGLEVGSLPRSCELGHLHHLEAMDGRIYHYLRSMQGEQLFLGQGFHFQPVAVRGRLLPGNYLLVQEAQVE
jgi:hypothetical protein